MLRVCMSAYDRGEGGLEGSFSGGEGAGSGVGV